MVNYHDPVTIAREYRVTLNVWHLVNGIFIWEFFTTLYFEWDVIRGNRPYRWTIWVYSLARASTLLAVIFNMVGFDNTTPIHCQALTITELIVAYLAFATSSLLIVLRVIAIWNRAKIIFGIAMAIWVADVSLLITGIVRIRAEWLPEQATCAVVNFDSTKITVVASLVTDIGLLLIMLIGLLRLRLEAGGALSLGRILWNQGLIWLLVATIAEVPASTFMILNLNVSLDLLPQTPSMIIVTIAATRMYRSLINLGSAGISHEGCLGIVRTVSDMRVRPRPVPLNRMEISVHTECDQYPTLPTSHSDTISTGSQGHYKTHEISFVVDVESGLGK